jgi:hypothetical protein
VSIVGVSITSSFSFFTLVFPTSSPKSLVTLIGVISRVLERGGGYLISEET